MQRLSRQKNSTRKVALANSTRGRRKKTNAERKQSLATPRPDKLPTPELTVKREPKKPQTLTGAASTWWDGCVPLLWENGYVNDLDRYALTSCAIIWSMYQAAIDDDRVADVCRMATLYKQITDKFPLTPGDRQKLKEATPEQAKEHPLDAFTKRSLKIRKA